MYFTSHSEVAIAIHHRKSTDMMVMAVLTKYNDKTFRIVILFVSSSFYNWPESRAADSGMYSLLRFFSALKANRFYVLFSFQKLYSRTLFMQEEENIVSLEEHCHCIFHRLLKYKAIDLSEVEQSLLLPLPHHLPVAFVELCILHWCSQSCPCSVHEWSPASKFMFKSALLQCKLLKEQKCTFAPARSFSCRFYNL